MQATHFFPPVSDTLPVPSPEILAWHEREMHKAIREVQQHERDYLCHELHDNINQLLAVVKLSVESLDLRHPDNQLIRNRAVSSLLLAMEEIRNLSKKRVSSSLEHQSFIGSVRKLAGEINQTKIFRVTVKEDGSDFEVLSCEKKTALFRIIQEQLNNAIKHSKASLVNIALKCVNGSVYLCIKDNGIGFNLKAYKKGVGLPGIYERAGRYKGEAAVKSAIGHGCSLYVRIPSC